MRLIDADALLEELKKTDRYFMIKADIDNAPTVEDRSLEIAKKCIELGRKVGNLEGRIETARQQGEREFIEIVTRYFPDEIVTYPEYRGKPYYSIHYRENGEEFVGYGTYNPDVLSRYLRTYFFGQKGGKEE